MKKQQCQRWEKERQCPGLERDEKWVIMQEKPPGRARVFSVFFNATDFGGTNAGKRARKWWDSGN